MRIFKREPLLLERRDAGRALAARLERYRGTDPLVLGLPPGGVVVAAEVARRLDAELDGVVARKLGSPISPELAIGAVTASGRRRVRWGAPTCRSLSLLDPAGRDRLRLKGASRERIGH